MIIEKKFFIFIFAWNMTLCGVYTSFKKKKGENEYDCNNICFVISELSWQEKKTWKYVKNILF